MILAFTQYRYDSRGPLWTAVCMTPSSGGGFASPPADGPPYGARPNDGRVYLHHAPGRDRSFSSTAQPTRAVSFQRLLPGTWRQLSLAGGRIPPLRKNLASAAPAIFSKWLPDGGQHLDKGLKLLALLPQESGFSPTEEAQRAPRQGQQ